VCDFEYHTTYIERNAPAFIDNQDIQISALIKNPTVWTARHLTDEQWLSRIQEVLYTPLDNLTVEIKRRNRNAGLGDPLIHAFARAVMSTGNIPYYRDATPICIGSTETTWARMYNALNKKTVFGLEDFSTFRLLYNHLAIGDNAPLPQLQRFFNKPPITIDMLKIARDKYEAEMGEKFCREAYELLEIDGPDLRADKKNSHDLRRNGHDVELALRFGVVSIPNEMLPVGTQYPVGLANLLDLIDQSECHEAPRYAFVA
jgi:hypothetical protein